MTAIDLDFEDAFDDARPPEPEVQRVLIATDGQDEEMFLWIDGEDVAREISEGSHDPTEHDIGEPPGPGLWVWEGILHYRSWRSFEGEVDVEVTWRGTYRAPTEDEWRAIRLGVDPWPAEDEP